MSIKALMDYTFVAKYARWIPDKKGRETWHETVNRVRDMMLKKYEDIPLIGQFNWKGLTYISEVYIK